MTRPPPLLKSMSSMLFDNKRARPARLAFCMLMSFFFAMYFYFQDPIDMPDVYQKGIPWLRGSDGELRVGLMYFICFPVFAASAVFYFVFTHHEKDFNLVRILFTIPALGLLLYRLVYYYRKGYLLYLIDFCFWSHFYGLHMIWYYERYSAVEAAAVFAALNGPVGGATFLLRTPMLVHHPEAFESFFLHVAPMWASYSLRWNWGEELFFADHKNRLGSVRSTVWAGLTKVYLPWMLLYGCFLTVQPLIPVVCDMESLFDWYAYGGKPAERNDPAVVWVAKVWGYLLVHCLMALQGLVAGGISFRYANVHLAWILCVLAGTLSTGLQFYMSKETSNGEIQPGNKFILGIRDCTLAWVVLLVVWAIESRRTKVDSKPKDN